MLDIHETLKPLVDRVVKAVHSNFPGHHDREDTEQAVWVWVYGARESIEKLIRGERRSWERQLFATMTKVATTAIRGEDQFAYGYSKDDVYFYPRPLLEDILEMVFDYEDWQSFAIKLDMMPRGKGQANETGDSLAQYADVKSAVERLPEAQYNVLIWRHKYRYTFESIGSEVGVSKQAARERWNVAVNAVQRLLGQRDVNELREGYSGRSGRSTGDANARTERDYEG